MAKGVMVKGICPDSDCIHKGEIVEIVAFGLCRSCYQKMYRANKKAAHPTQKKDREDIATELSLFAQMLKLVERLDCFKPEDAQVIRDLIRDYMAPRVDLLNPDKCKYNGDPGDDDDEKFPVYRPESAVKPEDQTEVANEQFTKPESDVNVNSQIPKADDDDFTVKSDADVNVNSGTIPVAESESDLLANSEEDPLAGIDDDLPEEEDWVDA